jgi:hypothetical protein
VPSLARHARRIAVRRLALRALALVATVGARRAEAQFEAFERGSGYRFAFDDRAAFLSFLTNQRIAPVCVNTLDAVPSGVTVIHLDPCATAFLTGASVVSGRIESATPFTVRFPSGASAFGVDFRTTGSDVGYISVFQGQSFIGTVARPIGGSSDQFLGVVVLGPSQTFDRFEIGAQNGSAFAVETIYTSAPEPSAVPLVTTGLLSLGVVGAARRRLGRRA